MNVFDRIQMLWRTAHMFFVAPLLAATLFTGTASADRHGSDQGTAIYTRTCIACHGSDGAGAMPGIPDLTGKDGPMSKSDEVLLKSILDGIESESAPTPMPPMGGDEEMTRADARTVLKYIRNNFGN